ncbi:MAG TPA: biotin/lipoyl-containing protein [Burkholderiales bacterium]|nr:biotin/lipoyl-containing protein [Burkholderiales bacterium]
MKDVPARLTDEDVQQIAKLVRELEQSDFEFLRLELGDLTLTISNGGQLEEPLGGAPAAPPPRTQTHPAAPVAAPPPRGDAGADEGEGSFAIRAPTLGRFYAQPEPGAAAFVRIGSEVNEDTTVGLLEVMKVFNAVSAGLRGVLSEICVQDGQFVEHGQILFRVRR